MRDLGAILNLILSIWAVANPASAKNCKTDDMGWDYTGMKSVTKNSKFCVRWSDAASVYMKPWLYYYASFPDKNGITGAWDECRNPDKDVNGPWCYYTPTGNYVEQGYCDIRWCSKKDGCPTMKQISQESDGGFVDCPSVGGGTSLPSLESCFELACYLGGNAVNFKGTDCWVKSCQVNNYGWSDQDAYDVYAIDMCDTAFTLVSPQADGKVTACNLVRAAKQVSLEACKQLACANGGNAFNFKDNECWVKHCASRDDLQLTNQHGAYDVYVADKCPTKYTLASPQSDGKATSCTSLGHRNGVSLEACKELACGWGANAFNFVNNDCYAKKCESVDDLKLTTQWGGCDVYKAAL